MKISEIFFSLNGEGLSSGKASIFVRTFSCNLACIYCDTLYAKGNNSYQELTLNEILKTIKQWKCKRVCVTGGEPLMQRDTLNLIIRLLHEEYEVDIETNGSILFPWWFNSINDLHIRMDWKCPCSKMQNKMKEWNWRMLDREKDAVKFVVKDEKDFKYVEEELKKYYFPKLTILISPMWGIDLKKVAEFIKKSKYDLTMQLQLHKYIGI